MGRDAVTRVRTSVSAKPTESGRNVQRAVVQLLLAMQNQARLLRHTRSDRVGFPEGLPDLLVGILEGVGLNVTPALKRILVAQ